MNFASDNIVGGSAPVLQAILDANAGTHDRLRQRRDLEAGQGALRRDLRARGLRLLRHDRHGGQCARPLRRRAALRALRLPPGSPHHRRRVRRAGILHAWGEARRAARNRRQAEGRGHRRLSAQPAQGGEADAAEGALDLAGERVRHGLRARRDRSPRRRSAASTAWPSTWTAPASSTRSCRSAAAPPR